MQVHDELIYEVAENVEDEAMEDIQNIMEEVLYKNVKRDLPKIPIVVNIKRGGSWSDLK